MDVIDTRKGLFSSFNLLLLESFVGYLLIWQADLDAAIVENCTAGIDQCEWHQLANLAFFIIFWHA